MIVNVPSMLASTYVTPIRFCTFSPIIIERDADNNQTDPHSRFPGPVKGSGNYQYGCSNNEKHWYKRISDGPVRTRQVRPLLSKNQYRRRCHAVQNPTGEDDQVE